MDTLSFFFIDKKYYAKIYNLNMELQNSIINQIFNDNIFYTYIMFFPVRLKYYFDRHHLYIHAYILYKDNVNVRCVRNSIHK